MLNRISLAIVVLLLALSACTQTSYTDPNDPTTDLSATAWGLAWQKKAPAPSTLFESQGVTVGNKLFVLGGFYNSAIEATKKAYAYSFQTNTWEKLADLPEKTTHAAVAVDQDVIYLVGGFVGDHYGSSTKRVWKYNIGQNRWSAGPALPASRGGGAAAIVNGKLHFFGGVLKERSTYVKDSGDHWTLNLAGGTTWRRAASMPNPRNHLGGAALGGKVYAVGGQHLGKEKYGNQSAVHRYDPATDRWQAVAKLPRPTGHINASTTVRSGVIVVVGGVTQGFEHLDNVLSYNPATNAWREQKPLPEPRSSSVAGSIRGRLVVTTGRYVKLNLHKDTWVGSWQDVR